MTIHDWASLALICTLGAFSPGPSLIVILGVTSSEGRKAGFLASFGHGIGVFLYALMATTGLFVLLKASSELFTTIQLLGAAFLMYLGLRILKSVLFKPVVLTDEKFNKKLANRFWDGFAISILNPKIAVFFLSLFSQFLALGQSSMTHLGMATVAGLIDTMAYLIMVFTASTSGMRKFLNAYKKTVELVFGVLLCILSASLLLKMMFYV